MKKIRPDSGSSLNEKPQQSSGNMDNKFGGRHGGRENIQSKAGEENLTPPVRNNFTKGIPKSRT
jgi:hypothetical protein